MGWIQRVRDDRRRRKATEVKQEIANQLTLNPMCSDYENVFAQVQPLINDMKMIRPFGVGKNGGRLPMSRTLELALLDSPNDEMGWGEFASAMFATWLTEDELNIHVHKDRNKVIGYTILPPGCKVYDSDGDYHFQVNNGGEWYNLYPSEVMTLRFSRSPKNLQSCGLPEFGDDLFIVVDIAAIQGCDVAPIPPGMPPDLADLLVVHMKYSLNDFRRGIISYLSRKIHP